MSLFKNTLSGCRFLVIHRNISLMHVNCAKNVQGSHTSKAKAMGGLDIQKKSLPVETDVKKLVNYCCGTNIDKEGEDVKLKEDSEYPDWLWELRLGPPPPLEEMDPNTKEYWEQFFFLQKIRKLRLKKVAGQKKLFVNEGDKIYQLKKIRFRALASKYDPGFDTPPQFDKDGWRII
ncbi:uncharacterized protein CDAR_581691 [Caerostris darwini]|uniref:Large ribosomal subunit protein mL54 n=1 Tax=Caerostris darwini TaxID=1538125 RepID=A0AAV4X4J5_9ARAC|nr:uncharacterized protein CDAR_581691 [Caerostris darwini]